MIQRSSLRRVTSTGSSPLELTVDATEARLKIANDWECALNGLNSGETPFGGFCRDGWRD